MSRLSIAVIVGVVLGVIPSGRLGVARADNINIGLYAPSEPFPSTAARVELASRLADHLGKALDGRGVGHNYGRAGDFAAAVGAAVKKNEVMIAVVDAAYLASAGGSYAVIAGSMRGGDTSHAWQLVARGGGKLADLKGKRVLVPSTGGRDTDFVLNVLLGGEVSRDFFAKIETAPDTVSALAALGFGKADAAVVPTGVELPAGVSVMFGLPALPGSVLVVYGTLSAQQRSALIAAAGSFKGDATIAGFRGSDSDTIRNVARRFTPPVKRGPLAVPAVRLLVGDLVEGRTFVIERTPVTVFAIAPPAR